MDALISFRILAWSAAFIVNDTLYDFMLSEVGTSTRAPKL